MNGGGGGGERTSSSSSKGIELWRQARDLLQDVNATTTTLHLVKCFAALEQAKYHCKDGKNIEIHIKAINIVLSRLETRLRRDPFETLGLEYDTKSSQARKAFYKLAKLYHPDKLGVPTSMIFIIITDAYNTLSDPSTWKSVHSRLSHKRREPFLFKWGEAMSEARGESSSSSASTTSKHTSSQRARPTSSYQTRYHRYSSSSSSSTSNGSNRSQNTYVSRQASKRAAYVALSASRRAKKAHRIALMHLRNARDNRKQHTRSLYVHENVTETSSSYAPTTAPPDTNNEHYPWQMCEDDNGYIYWYNVESGESVWDGDWDTSSGGVKST